MTLRSPTLASRPRQEDPSKTSKAKSAASASPGSSAGLPNYASATLRNTPAAGYQVQSETLRQHHTALDAKLNLSQGDELDTREPEAEQEAETDQEAESSAAEEQESTGEEQEAELNQEEQQGDSDEEASTESQGESEEVAEEAATSDDESSTVTAHTSEQAGKGDKEAQPISALVAALPKLSPIKTPYVGSPPKEAIEKREEILKNTGSPPEQHHAEVRQAVQTVAQAARDAQRRMIFAVSNLAKDTRISVEAMADEIAEATQQAVGYINATIDKALISIDEAAKKEMAHIDEHQAKSGDAAQVASDDMTQQIYSSLTEGSSAIRSVEPEALREYGTMKSEAAGLINEIPAQGEVGRIVVKQSSGGEQNSPKNDSNTPSPGPENQGGQNEGGEGGEGEEYKVIKDARVKFDDFVKTEGGKISGIHANIYDYITDRLTPGIPKLCAKQQKNLVKAAGKQVARLDADASKTQFMTMVLGLTAPASAQMSQDQTKSMQEGKDVGNKEMSALEHANRRAKNQLFEKSFRARDYCGNELRKKLTSDIRKSGCKAERAMRLQAKQAEIGLNSSTAMMAQDYRDMVARLEEMLSPGTFLDKSELVPRLLQARDSARELLQTHEGIAETQAYNTIKNLTQVKEQQIESLLTSAYKSGKSLDDMVTRSTFDFAMFSSQVTGAMSEGITNHLGASKEYANRMAEGLLDSEGNVKGKGKEQIIATAASFFNGQISSAESVQHQSLKNYVDFMAGQGKDSPLAAPMLKDRNELESAAQKLKAAMPDRDYGSLAKKGATVLVPGGQVYGAVAVGVELYTTDPDDNKVVEILGPFKHPGAPAVAEIWEFEKGYGNLHQEISDKISEPQRGAALGKLAGTASERGDAAGKGLQNSTGLFDMSREAREALAQGMSKDEIEGMNPAIMQATVDEITSSLDDHEREIALAYLANNRRRAVGARTMEALEKGQDEGRWGWIFSAEEAERRSTAARVKAFEEMEKNLHRELSIETSIVMQEDMQTGRDGVFREIASLMDPAKRPSSHFSVSEGRMAAIDYATTSHRAAILQPNLNPFAAMTGQPITVEVQNIEMSEEGRAAIEALVNNGPGSKEAKAAMGLYELSRVEGQTVIGQFAEMDVLDDIPGIEQVRESEALEDLSQTDQTRLADAFENPKMYQLERKLRESDNPHIQRLMDPEANLTEDQKQQLLLQLSAEDQALYADYQQELSEYQAFMQQVAAGLTDDPRVLEDPQAAHEFMRDHLGDLFARNDSLFTTPDNYSHRQFGEQMIMHGRASLEAGAALASEGWGTHDDMLKRTYKDRTQTELDNARARWREMYDEDMDEALGLKDRKLGPEDYALLAISPATWFALRGSETSGDLAMDLRREVADDGTDAGRLRATMMRHHQETVEGTGYMGTRSMRGTHSEHLLNEANKRLANLVLAEVAKENPQLAAEYQGDPSKIFLPNGDLVPEIQNAAFTDGKFNGDRTLFDMYANTVHVEADGYRAELALKEAVITTTITVLAMIATVAAMLIPGVNAVAAGVAIAIISGTTTMLVKAGMRGERYGWEEAANDAAMMAIEAASAGFGGHLGKINAFSSLGKIGGAMAREAVSAAITAGAQVALQDATWKDGFAKGLENIATGAVKGAAVAAVTAGISEGITAKLGAALRPGELAADSLTGLQKIGNKLGPHGSEALSEAVSEFFGTAAGEAVGLTIDHARGVYKGDWTQALKQIGGAAVRDMAIGAFRGAVNSVNKARYQDLLEVARNSDSLSDAQLRDLRLAGISAGVFQYGDPPDLIRHEVEGGRHLLAKLPTGLREQAGKLDAQNLTRLMELIDSGFPATADKTSDQVRREFIIELQLSIPKLDGRKLMQELDRAMTSRIQGMELEGKENPNASQIRQQLSSQLNPDLQGILQTHRVTGLDALSSPDLKVAAQMIARGVLDAPLADQLFLRAVKNNPELDESTFLRNLHGAVEASQQAQQLAREIKQKTHQSVMQHLDEEGKGVFSRLDHAHIVTLKQVFSGREALTPHQQKVLLDAARLQQPDLTEGKFTRLLERGISRAREKQQRQRDEARSRREKHMHNIPVAQRGILSSLPDDALVELRVRQQQGEPLSPAETNRLIDAAKRETPDVDIDAVKQALRMAMEAPPPEVSAAQQARMRRELESAVPQSQRDKVKDVPILVMRNDEFEAFTRSQKGQAVTLLLHGRPVVVIREGADIGVLREEGIHVLQSTEPHWRSRMGALDERSMAQWDELPLHEQLELYRNKLELELDAQQRLIASLERDIQDTEDPAARALLQSRLQLTQIALSNLSRRFVEVSSLDPMHLLAMSAGRADKPQWLDEPARLFTKDSQQQDTEPIVKPNSREQESDNDLLLWLRSILGESQPADLSHAQARNWLEAQRQPGSGEQPSPQALIDSLNKHLSNKKDKALQALSDVDVDALRTVVAHMPDSETGRNLMLKLVSGNDLELSIKNLAGLLDGVPGSLTEPLLQKLASISSHKEARALVNQLSAIREAVSGPFDMINLMRNLADPGVVDRLRGVKIGKDKHFVQTSVAAKILTHAPDADSARRLLAIAARHDAQQEFADHLVLVSQSLPQEKRAELINLLARKSDNAPDVVAELARLMDFQPAGKGTPLSHLVEAGLRLTSNQAAALRQLADFMQGSSREKRAEMVQILGSVTPATAARLLESIGNTKTTIDGLDLSADQKRLLMLGLMKTAIHQKQIADFLISSKTLFEQLKGFENTANGRKVIEHLLAKLNGDLSTPRKAEDGSIIELTSSDVGFDIRAAIKQLKDASDTTKTLKSFADSIEAKGFMAEQDAWKAQVSEAMNAWEAVQERMQSTQDGEAPDPEIEFAKTLNDFEPRLKDQDKALLLEIRPWFEQIVGYKKDQLKRPLTQSEKLTLLRERLQLSLGTKEGGLKSITGRDAFRKVMTEIRTDAIGFGPEPTFRADVDAEIDGLGIRKAMERRRDPNDPLAQEVHIEELLRQRHEYQTIIEKSHKTIDEIAKRERWGPAKIAEEKAKERSRFQAKLTEVEGEIAAFKAVLLEPQFDGFKLARGFEAGTGFDQVWVKRDAQGVITDILVVEAKGPGAGLSDTTEKGFQMSTKWVGTTLKEMMNSKDPAAVRFAIDVLQGMMNGAKISGILAGSDVVPGHKTVVGKGEEPTEVTDGNFIFVSDSSSGQYDLEEILKFMMGKTS